MRTIIPLWRDIRAARPGLYLRQAFITLFIPIDPACNRGRLLFEARLETNEYGKFERPDCRCQCVGAVGDEIYMLIIGERQSLSVWH